jgi:hypothetical protein
VVLALKKKKTLTAGQTAQKKQEVMVKNSGKRALATERTAKLRRVEGLVGGVGAGGGAIWLKAERIYLFVTCIKYFTNLSDSMRFLLITVRYASLEHCPFTQSQCKICNYLPMFDC